MSALMQAEAPPGSAWLAARFGVVWVRWPDGHWSADQSGNLSGPVVSSSAGLLASGLRLADCREIYEAWLGPSEGVRRAAQRRVAAALGALRCAERARGLRAARLDDLPPPGSASIDSVGDVLLRLPSGLFFWACGRPIRSEADAWHWTGSRPSRSVLQLAAVGLSFEECAAAARAAVAAGARGLRPGPSVINDLRASGALLPGCVTPPRR